MSTTPRFCGLTQVPDLAGRACGFLNMRYTKVYPQEFEWVKLEKR